MKKLISVLGLALLASCTSMPKTELATTAAPKFAAGTCAKLNPDNLESWQESNPDLIFYIAEVGKKHYRVVLVYDGRPVNAVTPLIKEVDEDLVPTECPQPAGLETEQDGDNGTSEQGQ